MHYIKLIASFFCVLFLPFAALAQDAVFASEIKTASVEVKEPFDPAKRYVVGNPDIQFQGVHFGKVRFTKIEAPSGQVELKFRELANRSLNKPIADALADKTTITLGQFYDLLLKQSKGEDGLLRTKGGTNVIYVLDDEGHIWNVQIAWWSGMSDKDGWHVGVLSMDTDLFHGISSPERPHRGTRVISR